MGVLVNSPVFTDPQADSADLSSLQTPQTIHTPSRETAMMNHLARITGEISRHGQSLEGATYFHEESRRWWDEFLKAPQELHPNMRISYGGVFEAPPEHIAHEVAGILLAGGSGSRLAPITDSLNKHLIPVYDKPALHFALSTLMMSGIRDICIITNPGETHLFQALYGDGSDFGIKLRYLEQEKPEGVAQPLALGADFIAGRRVALALGDNVFFGPRLAHSFQRGIIENPKGVSYSLRVQNPEHFLSIGFSAADGSPNRFYEKAANPPSNAVLVSPFIYPSDVGERAKLLKKSTRGEYDLVDLSNPYLAERHLAVQALPRDSKWFDMGRPEPLYQASVRTHEEQSRARALAGSPEEIALRSGWVTLEKLQARTERITSSSYRTYLQVLIEEFYQAGVRS